MGQIWLFGSAPDMPGRRGSYPSRGFTTALGLVVGGVVLGAVHLVRDPGHTETRARDAPRRPGSQAVRPARTLEDVLARPDVIPSHRHPLLDRLAPGFELADGQGDRWTLDRVTANSPTVLVFSHRGCEFCARQLFDGTQDLPLFRGIGANFAAISSDSPETIRTGLGEDRADRFPVLSDPGNKVAREYHLFRKHQDATAEPRLLHGTFILDRGRTVRWVNVGDAPFHRNTALLTCLAELRARE